MRCRAGLSQVLSCESEQMLAASCLLEPASISVAGRAALCSYPSDKVVPHQHVNLSAVILLTVLYMWHCVIGAVIQGLHRVLYCFKKHFRLLLRMSDSSDRVTAAWFT